MATDIKRKRTEPNETFRDKIFLADGYPDFCPANDDAGVNKATTKAIAKRVRVMDIG